MSDSVEQIFSGLAATGALSRTSLKGCSDGEIAKVREHFGHELPAAFEQFLRLAGRGAGKLFQGTALYFPVLLGLQQRAAELLVENGGRLSLPSAAMVFSFHQGYEFLFFEPTTADPPVRQYVEGTDAFSTPWPSFSAFLRDGVEAHLGVWPDLNG